MSAQLFVGRLSKSSRQRDVEDLFEYYGKMTRCELKFGSGMAYAFVDYTDRRDAEDAIKHENGREVRGQQIVVEWARGPKRGYDDDECYRCGRRGHFARDCMDGGSRGGYRSSYGYSRRGSSGRDRYRSRSRSRSRDRYRSRSYDRSDRHRSRSRSRSPVRRKSRSHRSRSETPPPSSRHRDDRSPSADRTNGHRDRTGSHDRARHRHSHSRSPELANGHEKSPE